MNKKIKILIMIVLFVGLSSYLLNCVNVYVNDFNSSNAKFEKYVKECEETLPEDMTDDKYRSCFDILKNKEEYLYPNFFSMFSELKTFRLNPLCYIMFIIVVAPAIMEDQKIIILDEPFNGIEEETVKKFESY